MALDFTLKGTLKIQIFSSKYIKIRAATFLKMLFSAIYIYFSKYFVWVILKMVTLQKRHLCIQKNADTGQFWPDTI